MITSSLFEDSSVSAVLDPPVVHRPTPTANGESLDRRLPSVWRIPTRALTLAGFRAWVASDEFPEKVRSTFVDGEIILDMSQEEMITHAGVKANASNVLMNIVAQVKSGRYFLDGVLITNEAAEVSNNPDGIFLSYASLQAGRYRLIPRASIQGQFIEVEGSPDWVMEIVSNSSVRKDTVQLRQAYYLAGIAEYWLIDARGEPIDFQILRAGAKGYESAKVEDGWQFSATFDKWFRFERQQDAFGWQFVLLVKEAQG